MLSTEPSSCWGSPCLEGTAPPGCRTVGGQAGASTGQDTTPTWTPLGLQPRAVGCPEGWK